MKKLIYTFIFLIIWVHVFAYEHTIHFKNNDGWDPYIYCWDISADEPIIGNWPGMQMTPIGNDWYEAIITTDLERSNMGIVFSDNGGEQTEDLVSSDIAFRYDNGWIVEPTIDFGSEWKYYDQGELATQDWINETFDDSDWSSGMAQLGYGNNGEQTEIGYGGDPDNKYTTSYFRKQFNHTSVEGYPFIKIELIRDDGAVVYLNGNELFRDNMPDENIDFNTFSSEPVGGDDEDIIHRFYFSVSNLNDGVNTIAAEIHQHSLSSSDLSFDLALRLSVEDNPAAIKYIHFGTGNNNLDQRTISWFSKGENDKIKWGYDDALENEEELTTNYELFGDNVFNYTFPQLDANQTVYYSIFSSSQEEWQDIYSFETGSDPTSNQFSFNVFGDSQNYPGILKEITELAEPADFNLRMGDVCNCGGCTNDWIDVLDSAIQYNMSSLTYATLGNHDLDNDASGSNFFDYYVLPENDVENNENYYSFTYGNTFFICLDAMHADNEQQYSWLVNQLQNTEDNTWTVVFFHRPFFTTGYHDWEMEEYRDTWWQAFDDYGVDLILNGHAHNYQRSKPLNLNVSDTEPVDEYGDGPTRGRCQIISGGCGSYLKDDGPGWFTEVYEAKYHYCKIDVDDTEMHIRAIDIDGVELDNFTLSKSGASGLQDDNNIVNQVLYYHNGVIYCNVKYPHTGKLHIYNVRGRLVQTDTVTSNNQEVSFSPKGDLYIVTLECNNNTYTLKIK